MQEMMQITESCQISMFYFCQSSVCLYSTLIRRFQDKLSTFFYPPAFRQAAAAAAGEPLSIHPALLTNFSFHWTRAEKKISESLYAELRPSSSLIRDRVHKLLKHLCPPNKFITEAEGTVAQGWGFEERMKQPRLRLETLSGIFHHFLSVQGMKPKCCHLHIFRVESGEKARNTLGSILN